MIKATLKSVPHYLTAVEIENHIQLLDEPISSGGNNQGPTPVQSIYAALGGCICMTLRIYADRNDIPLEKIEVEIDGTKKTVKSDDEKFIGKEQLIDKGQVRFIHAKIHLTGDLTADQIDTLDTIAGRCPVHKMLKHGSFITHATSILNT